MCQSVTVDMHACMLTTCKGISFSHAIFLLGCIIVIQIHTGFLAGNVYDGYYSILNI